jgi:hypothetical protein
MAQTQLKHIKLYENSVGKTEFLFDELPKEIQDEIVGRMSDSIRNSTELVEDHDWNSEVLENFNSRMEEMGWENVEVSYSGFYSQGDGASFTGDLIDGEKKRAFVKDVLGMEKFPDVIIDRVTFHIKRGDSRYVHENTVKMEIDDEERDYNDPSTEEVEIQSFLDVVVNVNVDSMIDKIEEKASKWLKNTCINLYDELEKKYEAYLDSISDHASIADYFRNEEVLFNSDGEEIQ